jgi:prolipoprotein diacylglyceryl transferase
LREKWQEITLVFFKNNVNIKQKFINLSLVALKKVVFMITWDVDPEIFRIGPLAIRYYSLAFVIGFFASDKYVFSITSKKHGWTEKQMSSCLFYILAGTFIGARLGHVLFYQPEYYLSNPLEIIQVWKGGLASHGGYLGVMIAIALYIKKFKNGTFLGLFDIFAAPALFIGSLIRVGNLMNSEIIGHYTTVPWAFVFKRVDLVPRHPSQIYESMGYFTVSVILFLLYRKFGDTWKKGRILGFAMWLSFLFRMFVETFKENQVRFENDMFLNMGQALSIPFIIIGLILAFDIGKKLKD